MRKRKHLIRVKKSKLKLFLKTSILSNFAYQVNLYLVNNFSGCLFRQKKKKFICHM